MDFLNIFPQLSERGLRGLKIGFVSRNDEAALAGLFVDYGRQNSIELLKYKVGVRHRSLILIFPSYPLVRQQAEAYQSHQSCPECCEEFEPKSHAGNPFHDHFLSVTTRALPNDLASGLGFSNG